jgi:hypothetical protein
MNNEHLLFIPDSGLPESSEPVPGSSQTIDRVDSRCRRQGAGARQAGKDRSDVSEASQSSPFP